MAKRRNNAYAPGVATFERHRRSRDDLVADLQRFETTIKHEVHFIGILYAAGRILIFFFFELKVLCDWPVACCDWSGFTSGRTNQLEQAVLVLSSSVGW